MAKGTEQKYFEKLNISVLSISKIKNLIKNDIKNTLNAWNKGRNVNKQTFHIIGDAGIGKTAICSQIVDELIIETGKDFELLMIKAPVLSRDDFIIPFPIIGDNNNNSFKMLYSNFVPRKENSYGLFVIDEFGRGDHTLQQLLWQAQNECSIHLHEFPKGWFVISLDNPDDSSYTLDIMEDCAGLRRQLHLYTELNVHDFLKYAIKQDFHSSVIEFIQTHPNYLYDFDSQKMGAVYANPASYEKLSDHLWKFELNGGIENHYEDIDFLTSGLLNVNKSRLFMEFIRDKKDINPKDIFYNYKKVRKHILKFKKDNNNSKMSELMTGFCAYLTSQQPKYSLTEKGIGSELKNIALFLSDVPIDTAAVFVVNIDSFSRKSSEFKYITQIHSKLMKFSSIYKTKFYEAIVECGENS